MCQQPPATFGSPFAMQRSTQRSPSFFSPSCLRQARRYTSNTHWSPLLSVTESATATLQ